MRVLRKNIKFHPVTLTGGGVFNATGRKNARRPFAAAVSTGTVSQAFLGSRSTFNPTGVLFGSSSPSHLTIAQAINQTVSGSVQLGAESLRISFSSEPANWAGAGEVNNVPATFPFIWSFKASNDAHVQTAAAGTPGDAFYDKWLVILRDQMPDVAKKDSSGNPAFDKIACHHEPFADTGWTASGWAQLQINLCKIVRAANLGRTNKIYVCGIMNGHDNAAAQFDSYYPTATLLIPYKPEFRIGIDCYDYYTNSGTKKGIYQVVRAHDYAVSKGYGAQWDVPELGIIIGSASGFRPTDAQANQMALDIEAQLNIWPATEQPGEIDWFNNGGQPFDGCDEEGHHNTTGTGTDCTGTAVASSLKTFLLPTSLTTWSRLAHKQSNAGLVPSNTLVPSATLVPSG